MLELPTPKRLLTALNASSTGAALSLIHISCALTIGTYGVARKRDDKVLRFYSMNFEHLGVIESSVEGLRPEKEANWTNYPKGVMWAFGEKGMEVTKGMDLLLFGNIPNGSGLSSSCLLYTSRCV